MHPGKHISFESLDKGGKGTQIELLMKVLADQNIPAIYMREPGSTPDGEAIRALLQFSDKAVAAMREALPGQFNIANTIIGSGHKYRRSDRCEMFLYLAARADYYENLVLPTLNAGFHVISDRSCDSTMAYQGGGRFQGDSEILDFIEGANDVATQGYWPTKTIYLDISPETFVQRLRLANDEPDDIEREKLEFWTRVRDTYISIVSNDPSRVVRINGELSIKEVHREVLRHLRPLLGIN